MAYKEQKSLFFFTLIPITPGQSILKQAHLDNLKLARDLILASQTFIYFLSVTPPLRTHGSKTLQQIWKEEPSWLRGKTPIPAYLNPCLLEELAG